MACKASSSQPKRRSTTAKQTQSKAPPASLLTLPNEVLIEIGSYLSIPDLRRLGRVNRKLYLFVGDYLIRYRCNSRLATLPNELILHIVQQIESHKDRSRLARASQRFYPLVMGYIARHNVRHQGSSLLNYSAKRNLTRLARNILHLGGGVNTQRGFKVGFMRILPTPLLAAAYGGHERMVLLLLDAGASQFIDGMRVPLGSAIYKRHEKVAMILSQGVSPDEFPLKKSMGSALQLACKAKLVNLVRAYLERDEKPHVSREIFYDRCIALRQLLKVNECPGRFLKREIHEDVFEIAMMLLKHGADPDIHISTTSMTARAIAAQHPDPRVRIMFSHVGLHPSQPKSGLRIGREWMKASGDTAVTFHGLQSIPALEASRYAKLWDFLAAPESKILVLGNDDAEEYADAHHGDLKLDASDLARLLPPPLSEFPQLGTPTSSTHDGSREFWAKAQTQVTSVRICLSETRAEITPPRSSKERREQVPEIEPFPQLGGRPITTQNAGKDLWANFGKTIVAQSTSHAPQTASAENSGSMMQTTDKSSKKKKKKWEPLRI